MKVKLNIYILLIVILFILSLIIIKRINTDVMPIMIDYIESNTNSIAEKVLIDAINDVMIDDDIVVVDKNNNNEITTIDFNYVRINKNLSLLTDYVLDKLESSDNEVYNISIGTVTNNIFLSNIGPKIPVKLNPVGHVISNVDTEVTEYGINNALIKVFINVEITEEIIVPFTKTKSVINMSVPLSIRVIEGIVPKYYGGSFSRESSTFSIPIEDEL